MALVRLFKDLMKDKEIGARFVPIIPGRGSHVRVGRDLPRRPRSTRRTGRSYDAVDRELLLSYKESDDGARSCTRASARLGRDGVGDRGRHVLRHARPSR